MARLMACDDNGQPVVEIITDDLTGCHAAVCRFCPDWESGTRPSDPISDVVDAAEAHVDGEHPPRTRI